MLKRLFPHPWLSAILLLLWLLLSNGFSTADWVAGAVLAWAIALVMDKGLWLRPVQVRHPWLLLRLALVVLYDIVMANLEVALLVLGPPARLRPAFIEVPLDVDHEIALTALISVVSLTPGTLCVELSEDRRRLLVHVLDLQDEAALTALIKTRYEAPLKEIFVCSPS